LLQKLAKCVSSVTERNSFLTLFTTLYETQGALNAEP